MVGAGLKDGMASTEIRAGSIFAELISGLTATVGTSIGTDELEALAVTNAKVANTAIQQAKLTMLTQSGTYSTGGAAKWTSFAAAFSAAPIVMLTPTQAHGIESPMASTTGLGSFAASGASAHTGNYMAWGAP